ncbi:unnamed protein product [Rotaria sp. Silwood1]|nr:unnamed protein product [Rotaria sp. Silwood1]CAF4877508.1 unnamed protein product [Rotaria sp. Silwood1]
MSSGFTGKQTLSVSSFVSFLPNSDIETAKPHAARRLRAPLMGRSIMSILNDDDFDLSKNDTNDIYSNDENELMKLNKQRLLLALLNRPRWIDSKRRGPLFG